MCASDDRSQTEVRKEKKNLKDNTNKKKTVAAGYMHLYGETVILIWKRNKIGPTGARTCFVDKSSDFTVSSFKKCMNHLQIRCVQV